MSSEEQNRDKPFVCEYCKQEFSNEDHLLVHKHKHDFSLKIDGSQSKGILPDQTPTPTRFLKICDQEGLFDSLKDSPFDQDFQKASQVPAASNTEEIAPDSPPQKMSGIMLPPMSTFSIASIAAPTPIVSSPYAIPSIPVAPPTSITNPKKNVPVASPPTKLLDSTVTAVTKQHLRQRLMKNTPPSNMMLEHHTALLAAAAAHSNVPTTPEIIQEALKSALQGPGYASGLLSNQTSSPDPVDEVFKKRLRRSDGEDDPQEKRKKFLERNRAAAARCRTKKKQWIEDLEKKSKEMEVQNQNFQQEITFLRQEVQNLKNILLAHRDCPLLISQQEQLKQLQTVEYGTLIQTDSHNETPDSSVPDKFTGNTADAENEQ